MLGLGTVPHTQRASRREDPPAAPRAGLRPAAAPRCCSVQNVAECAHTIHIHKFVRCYTYPTRDSCVYSCDFRIPITRGLLFTQSSLDLEVVGIPYIYLVGRTKPLALATVLVTAVYSCTGAQLRPRGGHADASAASCMQHHRATRMRHGAMGGASRLPAWTLASCKHVQSTKTCGYTCDSRVRQDVRRLARRPAGILNGELQFRGRPHCMETAHAHALAARALVERALLTSRGPRAIVRARPSKRRPPRVRGRPRRTSSTSAGFGWDSGWCARIQLEQPPLETGAQAISAALAAAWRGGPIQMERAVVGPLRPA